MNSATPEAMAHDWRALMDFIDADSKRQPIPCRMGGPAARSRFTGTDAEQTEAARSCARCPAVGACKPYGLAHPKELGVYGGLTETERRQQARRTKEQK